MAKLQDVLNERQTRLKDDLDVISHNANETIESICLAYEFLKAAIQKAKFDAKDVFSLSDIDSFQKQYHAGQIYTAAKSIPDNFGAISQTYQDDAGKVQDIPLNLSPDSQKFFAFIYHQLFISLMATLEAYLTDIIKSCFLAYPERLGDEKFRKQNKNGSELKFKDLTGNEDIHLVDKKIGHITRNVTGKNYPLDLQKALNIKDSDFLVPEWSEYSEMKFRRNRGVHSNWHGKELYNKDIENLKKHYIGNDDFPYFKINDLSFDIVDEDFLGFNAEYFCYSYRLALKIVTDIKKHYDSALGQSEE